jgi:anti-sigma-K factor RskA
MGVLGNRPTTVPVTVDPAAPAQAYAITVEPAGGVTVATQAPVAEGTV